MRKLRLETLESRYAPAATLLGGTLTVVGQGKGVYTLSVDNAPGVVNVTENGVVTPFDTTQVQRLVLIGSNKAENVIQNNTNLDSVILGGNKRDTLFGGSGNNFLSGRAGGDNIYSLLGVNTVDIRGQGKDRVFTNVGATVLSNKNDLVVRFFAPGRTPGVPFIGQEADGVLYITPSNNGSSVIITPGLTPTSISVTYDLGVGLGSQTVSFSNVKAIAYFGGTGDDVYINETTIGSEAANFPEAIYGSAGNDILLSGFGPYSILKGSGGDDLLGLRSVDGDVSGNGGQDTITLLGPFDGTPTNKRRYVVRTDPFDTVLGAIPQDVFISP